MAKTHYEALAVRPDATTEDVRKAYHKLARDHHPDRFTDPEQKRKAEISFSEMTEAFNVLADADKRKAYDQKLREESSGETQAQREARGCAKLGTIRLGEGNAKEAIRLLRAAVHLDSTQGPYYAQLAKALEADNLHGDASRAWDEAIKREPYNPKYYRLAGQCLEKAGMAIKAKRMYESALKWDKTDNVSAEALRRLTGGDKKPGLLASLFKKS